MTHLQALTLADDWNARHPVGSPVEIAYDGVNRVRVPVRGEAFAQRGGDTAGAYEVWFEVAGADGSGAEFFPVKRV